MNFSEFNNFNDLNETGAEFIPYNPITYEPFDCKIIICSANSRRFKKVQREIMKAGAKNTSDDVSFKLIAGLVVGWENIEDGDKQVEFTPENLIKILEKQDWLFIQIERFVEDSSNFFLIK